MSFSVHFNESAINQRYQEYKQAKAIREQEQKQLALEHAHANKLLIEHLKASYVPVASTKKPHKCASCGQTIPVGAKATMHSRLVNGSSLPDGYGHYESDYFCVQCYGDGQ
jgi:hypothetical protein